MKEKFCDFFRPGSLRAVTAIPSPWGERKAKGGEARGLRVTCHRFPGASLLSRALSPSWAERSLRFDEGRKTPEIRLSKLRIKKRGQVPAVHGATLRVPFRDYPAVGFVRSGKREKLFANSQWHWASRRRWVCGHPDRKIQGGRDDRQPAQPGWLCSNT